MNPIPDTTRTDDTTPPACAAFEALVQSVLDREQPPASLTSRHTEGCTACRELAAAAKLFLSAELGVVPEPPPDLAARILATAASDTNVRQKRRVVVGVTAAALAAMVLAAGVYLTTSGGVSHEPAPVARVEPPRPPVPAPPVRLADQIADAGTTLAAITTRVADQAVAPTRTLLPPPDTRRGSVLPPMAEPVADSLAAIPQAAEAGLEPVTATTRRAVNLFFRDFGMSPPAKPNS